MEQLMRWGRRVSSCGQTTERPFPAVVVATGLDLANPAHVKLFYNLKAPFERIYKNIKVLAWEAVDLLSPEAQQQVIGSPAHTMPRVTD